MRSIRAHSVYMTSDPRYPHGDPRWNQADWENELWYPQKEDTMGGWCITLYSHPGSPATGSPAIVECPTRELATYIAHLHNLQVLARGGHRD